MPLTMRRCKGYDQSIPPGGMTGSEPAGGVPMHEGDHSILGHDHEHDHNAHPDHEHHSADTQKTGSGPRTFAALVVAAGVAIFLIWRFF